MTQEEIPLFVAGYKQICTVREFLWEMGHGDCIIASSLLGIGICARAGGGLRALIHWTVLRDASKFGYVAKMSAGLVFTRKGERAAAAVVYGLQFPEGDRDAADFAKTIEE